MVDKTLGLWGNQIVDPVQPELERRWGTHEYQLKIINVQLNYYGHVDSENHVYHHFQQNDDHQSQPVLH